MSVHTFGEKVKVCQETFGIGELHTAYYPKLFINGKWTYIRDDNYKTNKINAHSRRQAKKLGEEVLERILEKQNAENASKEGI